MRRGYHLDNRDIEKLTPIMEGIIYRLEMGDLDDIELSIINLGPSQFMQLLKNLGYEHDDWDSNEWEQVWYNFFKEGHPNLILFYCGYDGEIKLSLREKE